MTGRLDTPDDDEDRNPIERIAAEFAERRRQGEQPTIEEYAESHPEIAEEIRELLPAVVAMEDLKLQRESPDKSRFLTGPSALRRFGDYLILSEIGRGGMGIVYEAEQQSLGRRVAIKVLPRQSLLDDRRLERFEREAQTAARLHHTNIVPIFGVGEQDGYHYYVMQFINGLGLDRIVRELRGDQPRGAASTTSAELRGLAREAAGGLLRGEFRRPARPESAPIARQPAAAVPAPAFQPGAEYWRSIARVGEQVADALSYAHSMDTLHRDIKPANLLLDEQGVVWITDFGLAKVLEESHLTHTGDVVGTLQYMAPEQFHGRYDERSEVYCLGLTLYELLTLRPAFEGSDRSTLMQAVTEGRPTVPRRLQSRIPADLETIVLKAINREPQHRYTSARALREDLQRFLDNRPILARRTTAIQLTRRWCKRNRALASAIMVAVLAVCGAAALGWSNYVDETAKSGELSTAKQQLQTNMSKTLLAIGKVFDHLAGPELFTPVIRNSAGLAEEGGEPEATQDVSAPIPSKKDADLLEKLLDLYGEFSRNNQGNRGLQQDLARAHQRIGDIRMRLGDLDEARKAYIEAILVYRNLDPAQHVVTIASIRNQLGQLYAQQHLLDTARESHRLVIADLTEDGQPRFDSNQALYELARAHDFLGSWGVVEDADDGPRRPRSRGPRGRPGPRGAGRPRAGAPGEARRRGRRPMEVTGRREHHLQAQALLERLLQREPDNVAFRLATARSCRNYYGFLWHGRARDRRDTADRALVELLLSDATRILNELCEEFPDAWLYQYELAETLLAGRTDLAALDQALAITRRLRTTAPSVPSYVTLQCRILRSMAEQESREANRGERIQWLSEAVSLLEELVHTRQKTLTYLLQLSRTRHHLAEQLLDSGDPLGAREHAIRAIRESEQLLRDTGRSGDPHLADGYRLLAVICSELGLQDEARQAAAESVRIRLDGPGR